MANEITINKSIEDRVKERIQSEFVNLIPDDVWSKFVKDEINWFITDDTKYSRTSPAPLKVIIRKELENMFRETIINTLNNMQSEFGQQGPEPNEAVKEMVKEIAPDIWILAVQGIVQKAVDTFRNIMAEKL